jgi:YD repeat-containing protein
MNLQYTPNPNPGGSGSACPETSTIDNKYGSASNTSDGSTLQTYSVTPGPLGHSLLVTYPNGTKYYYNGMLEDSNGNETTLTPNYGSYTESQVSDSLGRTPFSTNIPIGQPGQIPVGTYYVNTTGPTNNTEQYTVTFKSVAVNQNNALSIPRPESTITNPTNPDFACVSDVAGTNCPTAYSVGVAPQGTPFSAIASIQLPDKSEYTFTYDPTYGTISEITFPTGGYVKFAWTVRPVAWKNYSIYNVISDIVVTDVWESADSDTSVGSGTSACPSVSGENHWCYNIQSYTTGNPIASTVTNPDGSSIQYMGACFIYSNLTLYGKGSKPNCKEASRAIYSSSGTLLKSDAENFTGAGETLQQATSLYDGSQPLQQLVQYVYDGYNNVVEKDESGFYPCTNLCPAPTQNGSLSVPPSGGWLRRTFTTYLGDPAYRVSGQPQYNYAQAHIVDKPAQVLITDGSGHPYSLAQYGYDETAVSGSTGIINHDDTNYSASSKNPRGNLTSERHCAALVEAATVTPTTAANVCSAWLRTIHTYDLTGQVTSTTDPNGNKTIFSYADNYVSGTPANQTDGYATTVTHPGGYIDTYSYYYYTGQLSAHGDWNQRTTTYLYNDSGNMHRPTEANYPDGGDAQISYVDTYPFSATSTTKTGGAGGPIVKTTLYDGLGRTYQTEVTSDPSGTGYVTTTYDSMGRVQSVTNPYRTTSDPTYGITSYLYDALGRKIGQCQPDNTGTPSTTCVPMNSYQSWSYIDNLNTATSPASSCVVFQDENRNQWRRCSNGLGQLISVLEPNGSSQAPTMETDYAYDPLNDLLFATQCGAACPSANARVRTFTYDSLSRLVTSSNPETGTVCYGRKSGSACVSGYDGNGNLLYKTDARGVTTSYQYDALNRILSKGYSNDPSQTPFTYYLYGPQSAGCNAAGRLINEWTQSASMGITAPTTAPTTGFYTMRAIGCYDAMGRILSEKQYTPATIASGTPYAPQYQYDLAGNLVYSTDGVSPTPTPSVQPPSCAFSPAPSWTTLTFASCIDGAGHLQTLASNWLDATHPQSLFSAPVYTAFGSWTSAVFGNGLSLSRSYDIRMRVNSETDLGSVTARATPGSATVTLSGSEQSK